MSRPRALRAAAEEIDQVLARQSPDSTVVAGPVRAASEISRTGEFSVEVKYSVSRLRAWASNRPTTTAAKHRQPSL